MSDRIEPEVIAALLDGTLREAERQRVLERIMRSPEAYEGLVETALTMRALDAVPTAASPIESPTTRSVRPTRRRLARAAWIVLPLAAAATAAVLLIGSPADQSTPALFADEGPGAIERTFGAAWTQPGWSMMRGSADRPSATGVAYRAGVIATRYELAARAHDASAARDVLAALRSLLASDVELAALATPYADAARLLAADPGGALPPEIGDAALRSGFEDSAWYDLGREVEHARLLAAAGQADLLDRRVSSLATAARAIDDAGPAVAGIRTRVDQALRLAQDAGNAAQRAEFQRILSAVTRIASR